uniref:Uncharacterized protein n=1 Tax=Anopheles atroparvus TaxID=41427 RepID=A0A182INB0_ANOAO
MCDSSGECVQQQQQQQQPTSMPMAPVAANGVQPMPPAPSNGIVEAINPAVQLACSLSSHSMHQQLQAPLQPPDGQPTGGEFVSAQELEMENQWLREKLKEVTVDRDRLLCEVANLRLELDMAELKRLPEHSFKWWSVGKIEHISDCYNSYRGKAQGSEGDIL